MAHKSHRKAGDPAGLAVMVRDGEPVAKALRRFGRMIESEGLLAELRHRRSHETRREKRLRKSRVTAKRRDRDAKRREKRSTINRAN